jgi:uncharacterized protein
VNYVLVAAVAAAMAVGLIGILLPVVPGTSLILGAGLVYGALEGFGAAGRIAASLMALLLAAGATAKYFLAQRGARARGAPATSLAAGAAAGIVGFFVLPVIGLPVGAAAGVLAAEFVRTRSLPAAWRSTTGVIAGIGLGTLVELAAGVVMVLCWAVWVLVQT